MPLKTMGCNCDCEGPCAANFTFSGGGVGDNSWNFTDTSIGADSWLWDFGDGATSTSKNPSHTFADGRCYIVRLTITRGLLECFVEHDVCGIGNCTVLTCADGTKAFIFADIGPVTLGSVAEADCETSCQNIEGIHELPNTNSCVWRDNFESTNCVSCLGTGSASRPTTYVITLGISGTIAGATNRIIFATISLRNGGVTDEACKVVNTSSARYEKSITDAETCSGVHVLTKVFGGSQMCTLPNTIAVTI